MKKITLFLFVAIVTVLFSGCLTVQFKTYKFHFTGKKTGTLTITFQNIFAQIADDEDPDSVCQADYAELLDSYLYGSEIESDYPDAKLVSKKLYKKNGLLYGEVVFEFTDPAQVHLFKYDKKSPWMFEVPSGEDYYSTNGFYPEGDYMNVVFWDKKVKEDFELVTSTSDPSGQDKSLVSYCDVCEN